MLLAAVLLLAQTAAPAPDAGRPLLDVGLPPPELVGLDTAQVEAALAQPGEAFADLNALSSCNHRCDEIRLYGAAGGSQLAAELRKGRVVGTHWYFPGDGGRAKSFGRLRRLLKRVPETDLVWLGSFDRRGDEPAPEGWFFAVIGWPRWGRLTTAVVLVPKDDAGALKKYRALELHERDARIVDGALGPVPALVGSSASDLLRLYGEPAQVMTGGPEDTLLVGCEGGLASCDGLWVYQPRCYRGQGMLCGLVKAGVMGGRVVAARFDLETDVAGWRLPLTGAVLPAFESAPRETALPETYTLPDGSVEPAARRLEWSRGGVTWTVDVACPAIPHGLSWRKSKPEEWRVYSVFQAAETPISPPP